MGTGRLSSYDHEGRDWGDVAISQGTPGPPEETRKDSSLEPLFCQNCKGISCSELSVGGTGAAQPQDTNPLCHLGEANITAITPAAAFLQGLGHRCPVPQVGPGGASVLKSVFTYPKTLSLRTDPLSLP